ncbi:hypothetical protein T06_6516 [Trichinella sp. T6]|nr:hypothetical protein T06_6516 [Trichinella sp. T6]
MIFMVSILNLHYSMLATYVFSLFSPMIPAHFPLLHGCLGWFLAPSSRPVDTTSFLTI